MALKLKKIYDWSAPRDKWRRTGEPRVTPLVTPGGETVLEPIEPPVAYVQIKDEPSQVQHLSYRVISTGVTEGWLKMVDGDEQAVGEAPVANAGRIEIKTDKGKFVYGIARLPGRWCLHCGVKLADDDHLPTAGAAARKHVAQHHGDAKSPDEAWPHGYEKVNYYDCVREG